MAGRKSDFTLPTNTLDELFSSQEERDEAKLSKIRDIPLEEIDDFPDHPFQVREDEDTARLHYLLKDDLMKMDELTKQVTLLGKHQIGTDEQLFSYKRSVEDEIKTLTADRTHLRNEIRKVDISDERLSAAKIKISAISERLKELRKEVKLCDGIAKRSGVIADTLSQVKAEEEKSQRKESRNYEQRR